MNIVIFNFFFFKNENFNLKIYIFLYEFFYIYIFKTNWFLKMGIFIFLKNDFKIFYF
jgi:hypothetical protein